MTPTSVQLWERIHAAGLATPEECRQWATAIAQSGATDCLHDAVRLATELIRLGKLTSFQANVLFQNLPIPLAQANYRLTATLESELGANWFLAVDTADPKRPTRWAYWLSSHHLAQAPIRHWPPSLSLASKQIAISHPCLDVWRFANVLHTHLLAVCDTLPGQSLASHLLNQPLSWEQAAAMVEQLGSGLQAMHAAGLVHGRLSPNTVWCVEPDVYVLRRDPWFPPNHPYSNPSVSVLNHSAEQGWAIAAPEFLNPQSQPSIASDLYALGCLWYRSLSGHSLFADEADGTAEAWAQAHQQSSLQQLDALEMPAPLIRCLKHLLAKNPSARFASAQQLLSALDASLNPVNASTTPATKPTLPQPNEVPNVAPIAEASSSVARTDAPAANAISSQTVTKPVPTPTSKPTSSLKPEPSSPSEPIPQPATKTASVAPKTTNSDSADSQKQPVAKAPTPADTIATTHTDSTKTVESNVAKPSEAKPTSTGKREPAAAANVASISQPTKPSPVASPISADPDNNPSAIPESAPESTATKPDPSEDPAADFLSAVSVTKPTPKKKAKGTKSGSKKKKKKKRPVWLLPSMIVGACLIFGTLILLALQNSNRSGRNDIAQNANNNASVPTHNSVPTNGTPNSETNTSSTKPENNSAATRPTNTVEDHFAVSADNGDLLWAPPNAGSPYSLQMFPAGMEGLVFVSGQTWRGQRGNAELNHWWMSLYPELTKTIENTPLLQDERIASIAIALYPGSSSGIPQAVYHLELQEPAPIASITERIPNYSLQLFPAKVGDQKGIWSNESSDQPLAVAMEMLETSPEALVKQVVIGPQVLLTTLSETMGVPVPLRRQMEVLLQSTDNRSDLTILVAPSFLYGDGRALLGTSSTLQDFLREHIHESVQALSITATFQPRLYLELRLLSSETRQAGQYAAEIKQKLKTLPDKFALSVMQGNSIHPYWRSLGLRYPQMLRKLEQYTRFGVEDGQIIANTYVPSSGLSNLAISSWLAINNPAGPASTNATATKPTTKPAAVSIDDLLNAKISIKFEQESLEVALQAIATEVSETVLNGAPITMQINGGAFQKDGITRNQQIRAFKQEGVEVRKILTDLVRRANPVTTVETATDPQQKVVWVILDDSERAGQKKIELTTRTWATANQVTLPSEFVAANN